MVNWKPIASAPRDGYQIWVIDDQRSIYRVRWHEPESLFVDQMSDDAVDLTHWCELHEIPLPEITP